jgi:hypothetical protein
MRNQIWWVISILKEEKASNASFLYCGKKNPLVVSALHNELTILPSCIILMPSRLDFAHTRPQLAATPLPRPPVVEALTNIILNSKFIFALKTYHFFSCTSISVDSVSFNMLVGYAICACLIIYLECLISPAPS